VTIYPTHTCFDDALDYLAHRVRQNRRAAMKLTLVHGILLAPEGKRKGEPFAHAWVEEGGRVIQDGLLEDGSRVTWSMSVAEFREKMQPQKTTRYTVRQAARENRRTNHFGPWVPEYQALTGRGETFWPEGVAS
jgi:hypothetical protein